MPKATHQLELPVVLPNLYSQVNQVNEETEIYLSLDIKMAIYPTAIINISKFKIKIS